MLHKSEVILGKLIEECPNLKMAQLLLELAHSVDSTELKIFASEKLTSLLSAQQDHVDDLGSLVADLRAIVEKAGQAANGSSTLQELPILHKYSWIPPQSNRSSTGSFDTGGVEES